MDRLHSWRRRARSHPHLLDAALAAAFLALVLVTATIRPHRPPPVPVSVGASGLHASTVVLALVACAALALRRRRPRAVLAVTAAAGVADLALAPDTARAPVMMTAVVALYTVASRTDRPTARRITALTAGVTAAAAMLLGPGPWMSAENLGLLAWTGLAAAAGDAVRSRRAYVAAVEERAERAERTREEEARRRVTEERMRIARELHDVVAHHIALVNVQAGVAAHLMDSRPDQARQALAHVREAGRSALEELRATVGLLRQSGDDEAPTEPVPGLSDLDRLVESFARAGLPVSVTLTGAAPVGAAPAGSAVPAGPAAPAARPAPLPAAVDLAAYRVVQESLTNVHKHAGPHASAQVSVRRGPEELEITVLDDGVASAPHKGAGGHGLVGMRERAAALGGSCEAGPRPGGGYRVRVVLPLEERR
ncbi:hypothetical protein GCM10010406_28380 [Streptomyces thermolineatus]|uniref:histidine kinase n=1 Tax=Streptomyces thermolineatus TaxID=44033 RepID=A0ABN3LUI9_9ACTN